MFSQLGRPSTVQLHLQDPSHEQNPLEQLIVQLSFAALVRASNSAGTHMAADAIAAAMSDERVKKRDIWSLRG